MPSRRISRPTTPGSALKRVRQNASLSTTTFARLRVVVGGERPAGDRRDAEHVEDAGRDPLPRDGFGVAVRAGHHHAADARREAGDLLERAAARVPVEHVERRHVARAASSRCVSQIMTRRSGSRNGSGRSSVASTSAKIALLAPMPSASVSVATSVKAGERSQLPERELQIVAELVEPLRRRAFHDLSFCQGPLIVRLRLRDVAQPAERQLARGLRIHAALDELARPHLDVQARALRRSPDRSARATATNEGSASCGEQHLRDAGGEPPPGRHLGGELLAARPTP